LIVRLHLVVASRAVSRGKADYTVVKEASDR